MHHADTIQVLVPFVELLPSIAVEEASKDPYAAGETPIVALSENTSSHSTIPYSTFKDQLISTSYSEGLARCMDNSYSMIRCRLPDRRSRKAILRMAVLFISEPQLNGQNEVIPAVLYRRCRRAWKSLKRLLSFWPQSEVYPAPTQKDIPSSYFSYV